MQRFIPSEIFKQNTIFLNNISEIYKENMEKQLFISGYNLVDVVEDKGEFSVHGSIIDVFPINMKTPIRIKYSREDKI